MTEARERARESLSLTILIKRNWVDPPCLKVMGWWWVVVVAHRILVSAQALGHCHCYWVRAWVSLSKSLSEPEWAWEPECLRAWAWAWQFGVIQTKRKKVLRVDYWEKGFWWPWLASEVNQWSTSWGSLGLFLGIPKWHDTWCLIQQCGLYTL